jgi:hypothetical protein
MVGGAPTLLQITNISNQARWLDRTLLHRENYRYYFETRCTLVDMFKSLSVRKINQQTTEWRVTKGSVDEDNHLSQSLQLRTHTAVASCMAI